MALTDWMVTSGELNPNYSYEAQFNGETLTQGDVTPDQRERLDQAAQCRSPTCWRSRSTTS